MQDSVVSYVVPGLHAAVRVFRQITLGMAILLTSCSGPTPPVAAPANQGEAAQGIVVHPTDKQAPTKSTNEDTQPATQLSKAEDRAPTAVLGHTSKSQAATSADTASVDLGGGREAATSANDSSQAAVTEATPATQLAEPSPIPSAEQLARWNISTVEPLEMLACHDWDTLGFVATLEPTPDGEHFILGGSKVTLWKPTAAEPEHVFLDLTAEQHRSVTALAVAPDGTWFCAGDSEGQLVVWKLADRTQIVAKPLYSNDIVQIAVSPSGDEIATLTYGSEITTWDTKRWEQKQSFAVDTSGVERIEYLADQRLVAAGETTSLWNTATGKLEQQLSPGRYQFAMAATPDRQQFAIGTEAGLQFVSVADLKPMQLIDGDFRGSRLSFSADQRWLATCAGSDIVIYDTVKPQVSQVLEASGPAIVGVAWLSASRLLVSVTELGRIRVWGGQAAAQLAQLQPLHRVVESPTAASAVPATPTQVLAAVDVRTLPRLPGGKTTLGSNTALTYTAPGSLEEGKAFYHFALGEFGWRPLPGNPHTPDYLSFVRNGFTLFIYLALSDGQLNVSLTHLGNFDVRTLPKFDGGEIETIYENETSCSYTTQADLLTIETTLLRRMQPAGWTFFSRLNSSHSEEVDARDMEFSKGAIIARVSIRKFPATPDRYTVQATKFLGMSALPIPIDAGMVETDLISGEPRLVATSALSLAAAREFYDRELEAQGWLQRARGRFIKEDANWLNYVRGQRDLTIGLSSTQDGRTLIRVGEGLENLSWQLKNPESSAKNPESPTKSPAVAGDQPQVGIEAADFPLLLGAKSLEINADRKGFHFNIEPAQLLDIAEQYLTQLAKLGWQPTREGIKSADYVFLTFGKDGSEINLRAHIRDQVATVGVEGDGLLWNKPLPIPPKLVSYESWLRTNHHPASLNLLPAYETEMRKLLAGHP